MPMGGCKVTHPLRSALLALAAARFSIRFSLLLALLIICGFDSSAIVSAGGIRYSSSSRTSSSTISSSRTGGSSTISSGGSSRSSSSDASSAIRLRKSSSISLGVQSNGRHPQGVTASTASTARARGKATAWGLGSGGVNFRGSRIVRRALAEILHLVHGGPENGPRISTEPRIPVNISSGGNTTVTRENLDTSQEPKRIKSPYPPAYQIDLSQPKIESWTPRKNRYLLALCVYGRLSNQERCLRNYLIVAALLQRTLVIPTESCGVAYATFCWRWDNIVDVTKTRGCLAPAYGTNETVITADEYVAREGRDVAIDHIACCSNHSCLDNWRTIKDHFPNITLPDKLEYPTIPSKNASDFLLAYAPYTDAPVISLGNGYGLGLRGLPFYFEGWVPPFTSTCPDIWQPPPVIEGFVNGFIDTFLGSDYAAVHLRRSDFAGSYLKEGDERERDSFLPIVTVAHFIMERLKGTGVSVVYLATDASPSEIQLLEKLFLGSSSTSPLVVVRLPEFAKGSEEYSQFPWVKKFQDLDSHEDGILRALAEKHICANARFFIGTPRSTFSSDILRLRVLHERTSEVDAYLGNELS